MTIFSLYRKTSLFVKTKQLLFTQISGIICVLKKEDFYHGKEKFGGISINKVSFWLLLVAAVVYLVNMILHLVGIGSTIVNWIGAAAAALMICVVAVLAWRYVRNKQTVWKILYFVILLVALVGLVLPNIV